MRKLMTVAVGVAALCGMTAFAQPVGTNPPMPGTTPPMPPMMRRGPITSDEHIMLAHGEAEVLHRALMEGAHDPATLELVDKALTDRATLLQSELDRVTKLQAVVTAMQGGDKAAIQTARDAVKASMETVVANAKVFSQDVNAIREHLKLQPHQGPRTPPVPGVTPPVAPANQ